jgi:hypothetical protein
MITPTHDDVYPPFGPLFTRKFLLSVDEYAGISEIIEQGNAQSAIAGDTMNRWGARSAVLRDTRDIEVAGLYGIHP